jgi:hypothetical protein
MKRLVYPISFLLGSLMATSLAACGGAPNSNVIGGYGNPSYPPYGTGVVCYPPSVEMNGKCAYGYDFPSRCQSIGGFVNTAASPQLCKVTKNSGAFYWNGANVLNPSNPVGSSALVTPVYVESMDKVVISATGTWGGMSSSTKHFLGIPYTVYSTDCDQFDQNGVSKEDDDVYNYEGQPVGLFASDMNQATFVGSNVTFAATNSGFLRLGFNAPIGSAACTRLSVSSVIVTHCEDANGQNYTCP